MLDQKMDMEGGLFSELMDGRKDSVGDESFV